MLTASDCWLCDGQHAFKSCPEKENLDRLQAKLDEYNDDKNSLPASTLRSRVKTLSSNIARLTINEVDEEEEEEPTIEPAPTLDIAATLLTVQKSVELLQQELNRQKSETNRQHEAA